MLSSLPFRLAGLLPLSGWRVVGRAAVDISSLGRTSGRVDLHAPLLPQRKSPNRLKGKFIIDYKAI